jgi:quercetin dioxygenase-like cupin family protein
MELLHAEGHIDRTQTMYPSELHKRSGEGMFAVPKFATAYGILLSGSASIGAKGIEPLEYFCATQGQVIQYWGEIGIIVRHGFKGQPLVGGPVEDSGRLCYIDNCSDSLLVYPPRLGDPSLSLLSFPPGIIQRWHTHPSIRLGVVIRGQGTSCTKTGDHELVPGVMFCMNEREIHRFTTTDSGLDVISFHPDGDWGPTDENHTLINRTYAGKYVNE